MAFKAGREARSSNSQVTRRRSYYEVLRLSAGDHKGNFSLLGYGAGHVRTGRAWMGEPGEAFNFVVECDLMDRRFLEETLESAVLMVGKPIVGQGSGPEREAALAVPLSLATFDGYECSDRGGGSYWVPEKKVLGASVDLNALREFAGGQPLSFFVRLRTADGKLLHVNLDGVPGRDFSIRSEELSELGAA